MNKTLTLRDVADAAVQAGTCPPTYDYALPQPWVDDVHRLTGYWPQHFGFVWGYPATGPGHVWGKPIPLTVEAAHLLGRYETLKAGQRVTEERHVKWIARELQQNADRIGEERPHATQEAPL